MVGCPTSIKLRACNTSSSVAGLSKLCVLCVCVCVCVCVCILHFTHENTEAERYPGPHSSVRCQIRILKAVSKLEAKLLITASTVIVLERKSHFRPKEVFHIYFECLPLLCVVDYRTKFQLSWGFHSNEGDRLSRCCEEKHQDKGTKCGLIYFCYSARARLRPQRGSEPWPLAVGRRAEMSADVLE